MALDWGISRDLRRRPSKGVSLQITINLQKVSHAPLHFNFQTGNYPVQHQCGMQWQAVNDFDHSRQVVCQSVGYKDQGQDL